MKKNNNSYINKRKVLEFLDSKGFYIVLVLCICIISGTAYVVTKRNLESYVDSSNLPAASKVTKPDYNKESNNKSSTVASKTSNDKNVAKSTTNTTKKPSIKNEISQPKITSLDMPVVGDYTKVFAKGSLVYSKTLEQWTTHDGVDISAERGTPVKAASDGIIADIYNDYKYGIIIVVDSEQGIKTKYANLSTDSMVKKGDKIKKGDVISGVGNTAVFESGEPSHLHFEVIENGTCVDPKKYLK